MDKIALILVCIILLTIIIEIIGICLILQISYSKLSRQRYTISKYKDKPTTVTYNGKEVSIYIEREDFDNAVSKYNMLTEYVYYINNIPIMSLTEYTDGTRIFPARTLTYNSEYDTQDVMKILKEVKKQYNKKINERVNKHLKKFY